MRVNDVTATPVPEDEISCAKSRLSRLPLPLGYGGARVHADGIEPPQTLGVGQPLFR